MKICLMTSTYKLSDEDTNVPFLVESIVESIRHLMAAGAQVHVFAPSYEGLGSQVLGEAAIAHQRRWPVGVQEERMRRSAP